RSRSTQLDLHAALLQVRDEKPVGVAGRYVPVGVIGPVIQRRVAGIRVKDGDDLGIGLPLGDVILDEQKVKNRSGQISFERQGADTEYHLHVCQLHRDIDVKWIL